MAEGVQQGPVLVGTFFMVAEEYLPLTAAPGTWTFGLYHPCILLSGLTHAWSIRIFAVCIFEYIIDVWAQWCDLPDFAML